MKKIVLFLLCLTICFGLCANTAYAYSMEATPYYNNMARASTQMNFDGYGNATVKNSFTGLTGITTSVTITTKIQQKFLLFFWRDVDIGVSGNQWVDTSTDVRFTCSHSVSLPSGTYRAVVTYTVYGTGGEPDVITEYAEASY